MNKTELIAAVAESAGLTKKDTERVLNAAIDAITASLAKGEKVQLIGFGTFESKTRPARTARNPRTGAEVKIAASKAADRLLSLEGILASFVLCRIDRTVHISARSSGTVNVQLITEKLHGGGHFDMAGAQVKDATIKETFVQLKAAIDEYLNEA